MQTADPYPMTIHGGAVIHRTRTGYLAEGGPVPKDWRLRFYHGVWHATKGAMHCTAGTLAEAVRLARGSKA